MTALYETDYLAWTAEQADALRRRSPNELDWDNLLEEIEALGASYERELESRLIVLLTHILKWDVQTAFRCRSWLLTIAEQRRRIEQRLRRTPSLKAILSETYADAHRAAVVEAVAQTGLSETAFIDAEVSFEDAMQRPFTFDMDS